MKTSNFYPALITTIFTLLCLTFLNTSSLHAQKTVPFIGLRKTVCGNGLTGTDAIVAGFKTNHTEFEFGADIQNHNPHLSGFQSTISFYCVDEEYSRVHLAAFVNANYNMSGSFSRATIYHESRRTPSFQETYSTMIVRTLDLHAGFMLRIDLNQHWQTFSSIGAGVYHTIGQNNMGMWRQANGGSLMLSAGLRYAF